MVLQHFLLRVHDKMFFADEYFQALPRGHKEEFWGNIVLTLRFEILSFLLLPVEWRVPPYKPQLFERKANAQFGFRVLDRWEELGVQAICIQLTKESRGTVLFYAPAVQSVVFRNLQFPLDRRGAQRACLFPMYSAKTLEYTDRFWMTVYMCDQTCRPDRCSTECIASTRRILQHWYRQDVLSKCWRPIST